MAVNPFTKLVRDDRLLEVFAPQNLTKTVKSLHPK